MSASQTIALDAMGGDNAPAMVVKGANIARERFPHARFAMFGDERRLAPLLAGFGALRAVTQIHHTDEAVTNEMKPSAALRGAKRSSMRLAVDAVASGAAAGLVSAGNTGALMAMSKVVLRMLPGISRPAIAAAMPTQRGESVMLDLGANVECDAENLVQFAVMGEVFSRLVHGIERPSVGLLNVGAEELKGHDEVRAAAAALRETHLPISFYGFIEGNDIAAGTVDVVVTDGFTGNIALKTTEGTAKLLNTFLREAFRSSLAARLGYLLAKGGLANMRARMDVRRYNGAVFIGLDGIVVKSHGGTDAMGFANAVGICIDMVANDYNSKIREELARLSAERSAGPATAASAG